MSSVCIFQVRDNDNDDDDDANDTREKHNQSMRERVYICDCNQTMRDGNMMRCTCVDTMLV